MLSPKRFFKNNTHNAFFKALAGFGRSLNRLYENRNHDVYSNGELTVIKKLSKLNPFFIIDGGANVGDYTLLLTQYHPKATIFSFEPVESTFHLLKEKTNGYKNVRAVNKGLFHENCKKEIHIFNSHTHSSVYTIQGLSYQSNQKLVIELIKGDDFLKENKITEVDFLKLDIEGAEYDALLGFEESIKSGTIKAIQFEYGYINITTKKLLLDYYNFFESHDYVVGKIFPKLVEFRKYNFMHEDFIGPNFIAVKKSEKNLIELLSKS